MQPKPRNLVLLRDHIKVITCSSPKFCNNSKCWTGAAVFKEGKTELGCRDKLNVSDVPPSPHPCSRASLNAALSTSCPGTDPVRGKPQRAPSPLGLALALLAAAARGLWQVLTCMPAAGLSPSLPFCSASDAPASRAAPEEGVPSFPQAQLSQRAVVRAWQAGSCPPSGPPHPS